MAWLLVLMVVQVVPAAVVDFQQNLKYHRTSVGFPSSNDTPQTWQTFSKTELDCSAKKRVPWRDGQCYELLTMGPCREDQWLVLDKDSATRNGGIKPVCKMCRCCDQFQTVFWPRDGSCRKLREKLCQTGNVLRNDPFGEGKCTCVKEPPHARWGNSEACYKLYQQGPCGRGSILVQNSSSSEAHCRRNPCGVDGLARWESDNRCYRLGDQGPCTDASKFMVHPITLKPGCVSKTNFLVDGPARCKTDQNNECQEAIEMPEPQSYLLELFEEIQDKQ